MRLLLILAYAAAFAAGDVAHASSLPAPRAVEIPDGGGTLHGVLYKPDGDGPFRAVIALHDCDGLAAKSDPVQPRYADWAKRLQRAGRAVLLPDSYASRELGPQCGIKDRPVLARRQRVGDILASRHWLSQQSWVAPNRISLLGWGNGASAVLWSVRPQLAIDARGPDFHSAVVFYPDCRRSARLGWSARVPTLLLIGGNDNVSSPAACRQMIDGARGRSALARIVVYPGAKHRFDRDDMVKRGHHGGDAAARADAQKRVAEWLGE
ncbi:MULTISPECIES: dienelactone hydrolase family protein [Rhodopseudomonas]|uniref:Dienelactone hydrolase n=1 Tax=Rhodopseudomonas palustris TaxID=1076 RepID=A0A0D7ENK7_RHOPL|nr:MULTISPECIES: dienelactone hydrolase family protein [Rhodopseudomonas]KIZ42216.1 dienelactone hydrolase [Rhodopseudomonas palustris]MDF3812285.1 dienelactone hydrolase family protein [Rhodopseudomonas sp. BAL398]WOK17440.1 dienelactone hydrolase family protein [Rhodopseudomonas sp. BAL398]